jgi:23S rRNA (cytidine1920-2'-O)/16S rRNA (cytidine1409-2'-O)-methyltransferase
MSREFFLKAVHNSVQNRESQGVSSCTGNPCTNCTQSRAIAEWRAPIRVNKSSAKTRLDKLLLERGLAPSRERAQALVLAGKVLVNGQKVEKSGASIDSSCEIRLLGDDLKYVSRGGLKLERALDYWHIDVTGRICMDVGASTGGFTDCLLQRGAAQVIAVDTGHGQIAFQLRQDERVRLLEKTNARYLARDQIGASVTLITVDVSFISATLVLPPVINAAFPTDRGGCELVVLVKPQFEAGRENVGKGGIVKDAAAQQQAVERVRQAVLDLLPIHTEVIESPILGAEGNREFLLYAQF